MFSDVVGSTSGVRTPQKESPMWPLAEIPAPLGRNAPGGVSLLAQTRARLELSCSF
jgi:hypothetical protein